jgi:hypothetical protein
MGEELCRDCGQSPAGQQSVWPPSVRLFLYRIEQYFGAKCTLGAVSLSTSIASAGLALAFGLASGMASSASFPSPLASLTLPDSLPAAASLRFGGGGSSAPSPSAAFALALAFDCGAGDGLLHTQARCEVNISECACRVKILEAIRKEVISSFGDLEESCSKMGHNPILRNHLSVT